MKTIKEIETDLVALAEAVVQHGKDFEATATKHLVSTLSTFVIDVRRIADSLEVIAGHTKIISSPPAATSATAIPPDTTGTAPSIVGATTAEGTTVAS